MNKELDLETLDKVVAGVSHEQGENIALNNESLYRKEQIEKLKKEKEALVDRKSVGRERVFRTV